MISNILVFSISNLDKRVTLSHLKPHSPLTVSKWRLLFMFVLSY